MKNSYSILTILLLAFLMQACKSSKEAVTPDTSTNETQTETTETTTEKAPAPSEDQIERTLFASIERTPCFGRCPTYKMEIYSDGFVTLNGIRNVDMVGTYTTSITQAQMDTILQQAREIGFFTFEDKYDDGMISDLPSTTTTVVDGEQTKTVMRRHGYPKRIVSLEKHFDALMTSQRWTSENGEIYPPER